MLTVNSHIHVDSRFHFAAVIENKIKIMKVTEQECNTFINNFHLGYRQ